MRADHDVLAHRHAAEHRQVLEGAAHAQPGDLMRGRVGDRLAFEQDVAGLVLVQPAQAVEQRGLAGAVGADQAADVAALHIEAHAVEGDDAAEAHGHATHAEQGFRAVRHGSVVSPLWVSWAAPGQERAGYRLQPCLLAIRACTVPPATALVGRGLRATTPRLGVDAACACADICACHSTTEGGRHDSSASRARSRPARSAGKCSVALRKH